MTAATFCDTADLTTKRAYIRFTRPHLSCGLGMRYATPVGPIRADVGARIPGLQALDVAPSQWDWEGERKPDEIVGLPIAIALGIGEAF